MAKPFKGTINVDLRDSEPDWTPFEPPKAPDGPPGEAVDTSTAHLGFRCVIRPAAVSPAAGDASERAPGSRSS